MVFESFNPNSASWTSEPIGVLLLLLRHSDRVDARYASNGRLFFSRWDWFTLKQTQFSFEFLYVPYVYVAKYTCLSMHIRNPFDLPYHVLFYIGLSLGRDFFYPSNDIVIGSSSVQWFSILIQPHPLLTLFAYVLHATNVKRGWRKQFKKFWFERRNSLKNRYCVLSNQDYRNSGSRWIHQEGERAE